MADPVIPQPLAAEPDAAPPEAETPEPRIAETAAPGMETRPAAVPEVRGLRRASGGTALTLEQRMRRLQGLPEPDEESQ